MAHQSTSETSVALELQYLAPKDVTRNTWPYVSLEEPPNLNSENELWNAARVLGAAYEPASLTAAAMA